MSDPTMPNDPSNQPGWGAPGEGWAPPPVDNPYGQPAANPPGGYPPGYQAGYQPGYQPGYYGGPPPGYGYQIEHPQGTTVLVLGVLGLVMCGVLGPFAWVMGNKALKEIDASPGVYSNRGNVQAGRICGIVASVLIGLGILAFVLMFVVTFVGAASSTS